MLYKKITVKEKKNIKSSTKDFFLDELLALKNINGKEKTKNFLNPSREQFISPYAFLDMQKAVDRINLAIEKNEKILIWGDFDCDGVTSTSVLYKALKHLSANVITFIPDRLLHGHGLNNKELIKLISKEKIKLVITVDCGISNNSEINLLKGLGVDTIITDHHSTDFDVPNAFAIINPQLNNALKEDLTVDDITSLSANSGSAIAFKLAVALLEKNDDKKLKDELLVIASCGIVADVVPLIGENRAMVSVALELLNNQKEKSSKSVYKLLSKNCKDLITSYDIAFILAPRINAVGRLANAQLSFEFLTTVDDNKLDIIIEKLDNYNKIRQSMCSETYSCIEEYLNKNKEEIKNPAIILINKDWHIGIIGIVASKIVETYNKPCFLMTVDENNCARCSIRSNELINVYDVLKENENLFKGFGGHKLAGGFSFDLNEISFEKVKENILKTVQNYSTDEMAEDNFEADLELNSDDIEISMLDSINKLEPFGQNNEMPVFALFDCVLEECKVIGKEQNHLSFLFSKNNKTFKGIKWGENTFKIPPKTKCDIAFYLRKNSFNDVETIQFELLDAYCPLVKKDENEIKIFDHRKKTGILESVNNYLKKKELDIAVWAKTPSVKESIKSYEDICGNIIQENKQHNGLMFFDYPANLDNLKDILSLVKPKKIHFMNYRIDENIENYIRQINGMIKYCANKMDGNIELQRMSDALGVSESFIQIALEIMEDINSIKILDVDKIEYVQSFDFENFKKSTMYEVLLREFESIVEFKKILLNSEINSIEEMITNM